MRGTTAASIVGLVFLNPNGTIGFGFTIVSTPGGTPVHVDAFITLATRGGTWKDSSGNSGMFVYTPGAGTGGSPRPAIAPDVRFRVENLSSALAIGGGATTINTWSATPKYNIGDAIYDSSAGTFTVPTSGLCLVTTTVRWQAFAVATGYKCIFITIGLNRAGSSCDLPSSTASFMLQPLSTAVYVDAGEAIAVRAVQSSGGAANVGESGTDSHFSVTRLK